MTYYENEHPIRFAPNQKPPPPARVVWSEGDEHYHAVCDPCDWDSGMTCDRWQARRWAIFHSAKHLGET